MSYSDAAECYPGYFLLLLDNEKLLTFFHLYQK